MVWSYIDKKSEFKSNESCARINVLDIDYGSDVNVCMGNELSVESTQKIPNIKFYHRILKSNENFVNEIITENDRFILMMIDPDAPSSKDNSMSEYCHWLVTEIEVNFLENINIEDTYCVTNVYSVNYNSGNTILEYMGPDPPPNTGFHRYIFLLFKQNQDVKLVQNEMKFRERWGTEVPGYSFSDWITKNCANLKLMGLNYFIAQNEKKNTF